MSIKSLTNDITGLVGVKPRLGYLDTDSPYQDIVNIPGFIPTGVYSLENGQALLTSTSNFPTLLLSVSIDSSTNIINLISPYVIND